MTADEKRLAGIRLLVVDDNTNNLLLAQELLEMEGAIVTPAGGGVAAVAEVSNCEHPFDLVLMDLEMPLMDGISATLLIRHRVGSQKLPIVALTANPPESDREACLSAGMNDYMCKPFDLDLAVAVIRRHVRRRMLWAF